MITIKNIFKTKTLSTPTNLIGPVEFKRLSYESSERNSSGTAIEEMSIPYIGEWAKHRNEDVIKECLDSQHPLDILAVGFAYVNKGAKFRKEAIYYIEKFLSNPFDLKLSDSPYAREVFSYWHIYSTLSTLYEKEYDFDKAIECLKQCQKLSSWFNSADYTRIGDILVKKDIDLAIKYYEDILKDETLKQGWRSFQFGYEDALKKKEAGYVYKPRNKKVTKGNVREEK